MTFFKRTVTPMIFGVAHLFITACGGESDPSQLQDTRPGERLPSGLPGIDLSLNPDLTPPGLPPDLWPNCEDPYVSAIQFAKVRQDSSSRGVVSITAVVTNRGRQAFLSGAGQQVIQLYEESSGGVVRMVASRAFGNLNPNQTATVRYQRSWWTGDEFPPVYRAIIVYDPDISIDGNPNNDDCGTTNNSRERNSIEINRLFSSRP
jgi:hypothetical protein